MNLQKKQLLIIISLIVCTAIFLFGIFQFMPQLQSLIRTQVVGGNSERSITGNVATSKLSLGSHVLEITAQTDRGDGVNSELAFVVEQAIPPAPLSSDKSGNGDGGGGGGGSGSSGGGGGGDEPQPRPKPKYIFTFQPEKGHIVTGTYSGVFSEGKRKIVRLAHGRALLTKEIKVPLANYWFEMTAKDDQPGSVKVGIDINGRRWKTVTLDKNDNNYRTVRVGMLKRFKNGKVSFTLLNDVYDTRNPGNPPTDRNFEIDSWRLVSEK